jgi:hypothetical protein
MSTVNCPAGKYCPSGTSATQNVCPKGYYCPANSRHPTPCPKGNYCPEGASAPTQCEAGFYCPDLASQHTPCTPGFYCPAGAFTQLICSGNTFSAAQASVCSCVSPPHGSVTDTGTDCIITCDPGFAPYMGQCIPSMKPGQLTYLNADGTNSATPTQKIAYMCPHVIRSRGRSVHSKVGVIRRVRLDTSSIRILYARSVHPGNRVAIISVSTRTRGTMHRSV